MIIIFSESHTKDMRALCGQNVEFLKVKAVGSQVYKMPSKLAFGTPHTTCSDHALPTRIELFVT
jgi:hypothetical protein